MAGYTTKILEPLYRDDYSMRERITMAERSAAWLESCLLRVELNLSVALNSECKVDAAKAIVDAARWLVEAKK